MRDADAQVARLVELHADDAATRASDLRSLATALVVLATGTRPRACSRRGRHRRGAADPPAARPGRTARRAPRQLLRATAAALALAPVLLAPAPAAAVLALGRVPAA